MLNGKGSDHMDLVNEIMNKTKELNNKINITKNYAIKYVQSERDYKIELSKEVLRLKMEGTPVTIIQLVAYGLPTIATLRYKRDGNEAMYKIALEDIAVRKLELRLLESQVQREYGHKENI